MFFKVIVSKYAIPRNNKAKPITISIKNFSVIISANNNKTDQNIKRKRVPPSLLRVLRFFFNNRVLKL